MSTLLSRHLQGADAKILLKRTAKKGGGHIKLKFVVMQIVQNLPVLDAVMCIIML